MAKKVVVDEGEVTVSESLTLGFGGKTYSSGTYGATIKSKIQSGESIAKATARVKKEVEKFWSATQANAFDSLYDDMTNFKRKHP